MVQSLDVFQAVTTCLDHKFLRPVVPAIILGLIGFGIYVYCYVFCYCLLWKENVARGVAVAFIVVVVCWLVDVFICWIQCVRTGPGKCSSVAPLRLFPHQFTPEAEQTTPAPRLFRCDADGFPFWCSHCQSIKPDRVKHSAKDGTCVPRFDHYCLWLGTLIGHANYRYFLLFCYTFLLLMLFVVVTLACYSRRYYDVHPGHVLDGKFIALFIIAGIWVILVGALVATHIDYIRKDLTTIDDMAMKRDARVRRNRRATRHLEKSVAKHDAESEAKADPEAEEPTENPCWWMNVQIGSERAVVPVFGSDFPYRRGFAVTWKLLMGPQPIGWLLPIPVSLGKPRDGEMISEYLGNEPRVGFYQELVERFRSGLGKIAAGQIVVNGEQEVTGEGIQGGDRKTVLEEKTGMNV